MLARAPVSVRDGRASARSTPARVLVVRPDDRLGNLLLLTPFLRRLREALPEARIGLLTGDVYAPLLRAWPWVDEWIVQDKRAHIRSPVSFVSWIRDIRHRRFEWAFEMSNHNTHSYYSCLLTLASAAGERIGFDEPRNADTLTRAVPAPPATLHFSQAPLALLRGVGLSAEPAVMTCPLPPASGNAMEEADDDGTIVLHVGGRGGKALPAETWSAVLDRLLDACPSAPVLLVAGPRETDRLPARRKTARVRVATGLGVVELAHRLRRARLFVGCDTGVMHLAAAVGTPTVSVFFRSNPVHYAPLGRRIRPWCCRTPTRSSRRHGVRPAVACPEARSSSCRKRTPRPLRVAPS